MTGSSPTPASGGDHFNPQSLPVVAQIETDRYCDHCSANLHSQPVRKDARTGMLLVQCPDCNTFQNPQAIVSATGQWNQRIVVLLSCLWMLLAMTLLIANPVMQYRDVSDETADAWRDYQNLAERNASREDWGENWPKFYESQRLEYQKRVDDRVWEVIARAVLGGMLASWVLCILLPHWSFRAGLLVVFVIPAGINTSILLYNAVFHENVFALSWHVPLIHGIVQVLTGVFGLIIWRTVMRSLASIFTPRFIRVHLGYLWTLDDLDPPQLKER